MENVNNSAKRFRYPFVAILFTLLATLAFLVTPLNIVSGLVFAISTGLGILFGYRSIKYKKFSDRLIGIICLLLAAFLAVITFLGYIFHWDTF